MIDGRKINNIVLRIVSIMTPIYKTAYPYFSEKKKLSMEIVMREYRLAHEEIQHIKSIKFDDINFQLFYAVIFIIFKNLNYFPELDLIPKIVIDYIKDQLQITSASFIVPHASSVSRYKNRIYKHHNVTPWKSRKNKDEDEKEKIPQSEIFINNIAKEAAEIHNYPADIINVVVEECKRKGFELQTFKQLDRIVRHAREVVNQNLFKETYNALPKSKIHQLNELLEVTDDYKRSGYNDLKSLPKNPTITNFRDLLKHLDWLESFGDVEKYIGNIIPIKRKQFAEQAKTLHAGNLKSFSLSKRYALILSLVAYAKSKAKDGLAITFCKTMFGMHKKARSKLGELREHYRSRTQELLLVFSNILGVVKDRAQDGTILDSNYIVSQLDEYGGVDFLKSDCDEAIALNSNNYLTFLLKSYAQKRGTLLCLLESLNLQSSTQEDVLIKAIHDILKISNKRTEYIACEIDLSFTTEQWRKIILKKRDDKMGVDPLLRRKVSINHMIILHN